MAEDTENSDGRHIKQTADEPPLLSDVKVRVLTPPSSGLKVKSAPF